MNLRPSINALLGFIKSEQGLDGSFISFYNSPNSPIQNPSQNTFTTSLVLGCLQHLAKAPKAKRIIEPAINFLLDQKNSDWSWNYCPLRQSNSVARQEKSLASQATPYPNDWDDTACALIAISLYIKKLITPETLGILSSLLIQTEKQPGGPYNTWILSEPTKDWQDIDPVVNANIGYFLKLHTINLQPLERYVEEIISQNNYLSCYYHTPESIIYFISRYYNGSSSKKLISFLLNRQNKGGLWDNDLLTSLTISSLIRLNANPALFTKAINHIQEISLQNNWQTYPLYIENNKKTITYSGAPVLTAAFTLEALTLWNNHQTTLQSKQNAKQNNYPKKLNNIIIQKIKNRLSFLPKKISQKTNILIENIISKDKNQQITLLSYYFSQSLQTKQKITENQLIALGIANLYGWLAYTIYDNIIDQDSGPELLPVANICLRELVCLYKNILPSDSFKLFQELMDTMEEANSWENIFSRILETNIIRKKSLELYSKNLLSDKSLPHVLGPVTILLLLGYRIDSIEIKYTLSFFKNYLAARQLNDDAHDWQKDLDKGFLNSVSFSLIHNYFQNHPEITNLSTNKEKPTLQKLFWESHIITIAEEINVYIENAQVSLNQLKDLQLIKNKIYLEKLLIPLKQSTEQINSNKKEIGEFLTSFQS